LTEGKNIGEKIGEKEKTLSEKPLATPWRRGGEIKKQKTGKGILKRRRAPAPFPLPSP